MTWRGFCDVAALSKYTSGLPLPTLRARMGKSGRKFLGSNMAHPSAGSVDLHLYLAAVYPHRIGLDRIDRGQTQRLPAAHVEARAVAWALDLVLEQFPLIERPAIV